MMAVGHLALRDLWEDRTYFLCSVTMIASMLLPLLVLLGAKTGFYGEIMRELRNSPGILQISTTGNVEITPYDLGEVQKIEGVRFAIGRTRAFFDTINVRGEGRAAIVDAVVLPTAPGDPMLPRLIRDTGLQGNGVVISKSLAGQADVEIGSMMELVTQSEARSTQLRFVKTVTGFLDETEFTGRTLLVDTKTAEAIEAFYEGYAIPDLGIDDGASITERTQVFEAVRIHADDIRSVRKIQDSIDQVLRVSTTAQTQRIEDALVLGARLDKALAILATISLAGLIGTLSVMFWAAVDRKRGTLSVLSSLGVPHWMIAMFPVWQALAIAVIGTGLAALGFSILANAAESVFPNILQDGQRLVQISKKDLTEIVAGVIAMVCLTSSAAAIRAGRTAPAIAMRGNG